MGVRRWFSSIAVSVFAMVQPVSSSAQEQVLSDDVGWAAHDGAVTAVSFSSDGNWLASAGLDESVELWRVDGFVHAGTLNGNGGPVWGLSWSPDGRRLVSGSEDGSVRLWNLESRTEARTLKASGPVLSVAVSDDMLRLAAGTGSGTVQVWSYRNPGRSESVPGATDILNQIRFLPMTNTLVIPRSPSGLSLWDAALDEPVTAIDGGASPVAVSPDGRLLATGSGRDDSIILWDISRREEIATLRAHTGLISSVAFAPDGRRLASGSWDTTVRVWDSASGQLIGTEREDYAVWSVAFSRDGQWLVAGTDHGVLKRRRVSQVPIAVANEAQDSETPSISGSGVASSGSGSNDPDPSAIRRPGALGVILGIEDYRYAPDVTFARQDARSMRTYFANRLGLAPENIYFRADSDATQGEFRKVFDPNQGWLAKRIVPDETDVFVYYVGHGTPDIATGDAYLMPSDSDPNYPATNFRLDELYGSLGQLPARTVTVMLDACFSGRAGRGEGVEMLLEGARGIGVTPRRAEVGDRLVVLTASAGNQVSSSYPEKSHGLFTYFLMRGLRGDSDEDGDRVITVNELYRYVRRNVSATAGRLDREQTPELHGIDVHRVLVRY